MALEIIGEKFQNFTIYKILVLVLPQYFYKRFFIQIAIKQKKKFEFSVLLWQQASIFYVLQKEDKPEMLRDFWEVLNPDSKCSSHQSIILTLQPEYQANISVLFIFFLVTGSKLGSARPMSAGGVVLWQLYKPSIINSFMQDNLVEFYKGTVTDQKEYFFLFFILL